MLERDMCPSPSGVPHTSRYNAELGRCRTMTCVLLHARGDIMPATPATPWLELSWLILCWARQDR